MDILNITFAFLAIVAYAKHPWQDQVKVDSFYTGWRQWLEWPYNITKD
jgi:hypothetical protein